MPSDSPPAPIEYATPQAAPQPGRFATLTRALRSRNYRLFFGGQFISLVGSWVTSIAMGWLVFDKWHSEFLVGAVVFAGQIPTFFSAPFAGAFVDRWPLRRTLVITQALSLIQSALLAIMVLGNHVTLPYLIVLALAQGLINSIDIPARQAFVVQILEDRADLPNAIALNSSMVNAARLIGPVFAGTMIATIGIGFCFLLDSISYIGVIIALLAIRLPKRIPHVGPRMAVFQSMKEGFAASFGFAPIRAILLLLALVSVAGIPFSILLPAFSRETLGGDSTLYAVLSGASGFGALLGGIFLASRRSVIGMGRRVTIACIAFGVGLMLFSFSRNAILSVAMMPVLGACVIIQMAGSNAMLQTLADDDKRGRVMAMFAMCFMGTVPIGALLCGWVAEHTTPAWTMFGGGAACVIGGVVFHLQRKKLRELVTPIYIKRGILPEIATGIRNATTNAGAAEIAS